MPVTERNLGPSARAIIVPLLVSFETGEQVTDYRLHPPPGVDLRLVEVRWEVVKALAATNAGTIDIKTPAGDVAITQISIAASAALGTRGTATLSTNDGRLRIGENQPHAYHGITTAKGAAGGKVQLNLVYRRIQRGTAQA
jgi:hypothetical protein